MTAVQSIVGLAAGLISIVGAGYSAMQFFTPPSPQYGEVVAIVREARTDRPVADATVEVFTREDALVTTVTADKGLVRQPLKEGLYRLRVSHPRFGAESRHVQVQARQTAEVRFQLRSGGSSPVGSATRAVNEGVGAVSRFFRGLGL
jgi:hypothetical protein